jgi:hypothetical protein
MFQHSTFAKLSVFSYLFIYQTVDIFISGMSFHVSDSPCLKGQKIKCVGLGLNRKATMKVCLDTHEVEFFLLVLEFELRALGGRPYTT